MRMSLLSPCNIFVFHSVLLVCINVYQKSCKVFFFFFVKCNVVTPKNPILGHHS
jgi:hypothetical protein